jgi:hypothetical protein
MGDKPLLVFELCGAEVFRKLPPEKLREWSFTMIQDPDLRLRLGKALEGGLDNDGLRLR